MKRIIIVPKKRAASLIPRIKNTDSLYYYLTDDYSHFRDLRDKFSDKIKINNLSGLFQETFQEIKGSFLELIATINKEYDSFEWWAGHVASRNSASTPLLLNIVYVFCVKKILSCSGKEVIFIVNSQALSNCICNIAIDYGYQVVDYRSRINEYLKSIRRCLYYSFQIHYFFWQILQSRWAAFKLLKPLPAKKSNAKKRIVIRSWITKGTFNESGEFKDRNFGSLPEWLRSKNYEVWTLPMFFNLSITVREVFYLMNRQKREFLIPEHYLRISDFLRLLYGSFQLLKKRIKQAQLLDVDVGPIFNEVIKNIGFDVSLLTLNLSCLMLKRLRQLGFEIDGFYYPFENNPPEKPFILCCRKYFPKSRIVGFQHTTFFPNQLAYHLGPGEEAYHPLPDKIVCSGPIYVNLHKGAGFPSEMLVAGPNLRFESVYVNKGYRKDVLAREKRILMLPLTFSHNLAFELFAKVKGALNGNNDFDVYLRSHPLLSKKKLIAFLRSIDIGDYQFADDGIIQEWLPKMYAIISMGASITILEAVATGVPVIRVVPDNTVFYDPFSWPDYPFEPVNSALEIKKQLQLIDEILDNDKEAFEKIARQVLTDYFTEPTEENLRVFL